MTDTPSLRSFFVCDNCRNFCDGYRSQCRDEEQQQYPRKLHITCLGPHCDEPCELQKPEPEGLDYRMLLDSMQFLATQLNRRLKNV